MGVGKNGNLVERKKVLDPPKTEKGKPMLNVEKLQKLKKGKQVIVHPIFLCKTFIYRKMNFICRLS